MQGLDGLAGRLAEYRYNGTTPRSSAELYCYRSTGARFAKWRSPLEIDVKTNRPTKLAIQANMLDLARVSLISQSEGLVPAVEVREYNRSNMIHVAPN